MQLTERELAAGTGREKLPWLLNTWYAAQWSAELPPGKIVARTILGKPIILYRKPDGGVAAIADYCPHRLAPLSAGRVLPNGHVQCGYHGLEYDDTGACVHNPHGGKIPHGAIVPSYATAEKHEMVWIWMGSGTPDESKITDYSMFDGGSPLFRSGQDYLHLNAPYTLVTDNLMDLSHVSYLHEGTLGNVEMVETVEPSLEQRGHQVEITRYSPDVPVPGILDMMYQSNGRRADKWASIRWDAPGNFLVTTSAGDRGAARADGTGYFGQHLLTPETENATHYFFWAARWNVRETDVERSQKIQADLTAGRRAAFEFQDGPIIEAQHRTRQFLGDSVRPTLLATDAAAARVNRVLNELLAAEAEA